MWELPSGKESMFAECIVRVYFEPVTVLMNHCHRTIISLYGNAQDNESARIDTFCSEWPKVVFIVITVYYLFPNQLHCFGQMTMTAFRNAYNVSNWVHLIAHYKKCLC